MIGIGELGNLIGLLDSVCLALDGFNHMGLIVSLEAIVLIEFGSAVRGYSALIAISHDVP